jgi:ATP-dependent Clp protease ATP-binding subunit ClpA
VLLDDSEGLAAGLIDRSGGRSREALSAVEAALAKVPKVSGSGAGQAYLAPALARVFEQAQKLAEKAGDSYVTVERLLIALAIEKDARRPGSTIHVNADEYQFWTTGDIKPDRIDFGGISARGDEVLRQICSE